MACTIKPEDIKRVKAQGFLNNKGTDLFNGRIITVNGKITPEQTAVIAEAAKLYGTEVEFTTRLTVEVRGIHYDNIEAFQAHIAKAGLITGGTGSLVRPVVSCKGTTCQYGLYDTFDLSEKIHERFYLGYHTVKLPHKFKIATGGCPNNCVKPDLNDLGIVGQLVPNFDEDMCNGCKKCQVANTCPMKACKVEDGVLLIDPDTCNNCGRCVGKCPFGAIEDGTPGYVVYIGGRWGKKVAHGQKVNAIFTTEEAVLNFVEKAILFFREQGQTGERFADTIARIGFENVEKELLSDAILERKQEILDAQLHLTGGATC
ncbi:MAG: 4Fe-4S binding protein [Bacillota bacterium]|nr:4Fe-4S binding protein [Bacillota bacterium]